MKTVLLRNLTVWGERRVGERCGSKEGFLFSCVFFPLRRDWSNHLTLRGKGLRKGKKLREGIQGMDY